MLAAIVAVIARAGVAFAEIVQDLLLAACSAQGESHHAVELVVFRRLAILQGREIDLQVFERHVAFQHTDRPARNGGT